MNRSAIIFFTIFIFLFAGCKKKTDFDPTTKTQNDFIGSWRGVLTAFKDNQNLKQTGLIVIYPDAGSKSLSGIIFGTETSVFRVFQYNSGTIYFKVENNDPNNPKCQNWSLSGYANFIDDKTIDIRISGNECGNVGSEYISWAGNLGSVQIPADSIRYFNFAKTGNSWSYGANLVSGDTCQVQRTISLTPSDYYFTGNANQTFGWGGLTWTLKWTVTPDRFTMMLDSTLSQHTITFPLNAKTGVSYKSVILEDTTYVTLENQNDPINTPAGNFSCYRFKYLERAKLSNGSLTWKGSTIWINNRFGIIKQVLDPGSYQDTTMVATQSLLSKSF